MMRSTFVQFATIFVHIVVYVLGTSGPTSSHEIYSTLRNKNGILCCGGNDCARTTYRENGHKFQFLTRKQEWVEIPDERIQFLPVPGDQPVANDEHVAHLCYRDANEFDVNSAYGSNVFIGENGSRFYLYCAFIPPGSI